MDQHSLQVLTSRLAVECFVEFIYTGKVHGVQMMTKKHLQNMFNLGRHLQSNPFMRYICRQRPDFVPLIEILPNEAISDKENCDTTTVEKPVNVENIVLNQVAEKPSVEETDNNFDCQMTKNAAQEKIANCIISKLCNGMKMVKKETLSIVEVDSVRSEQCGVKPELSPKTLDTPQLFLDNCSDIETDNSNPQLVVVCSSIAMATLPHKETTSDSLKSPNSEKNLVILPKVSKLLFNNEVLSSSSEDKSVEKNYFSNKETTSVVPNTTAISKTLNPPQLFSDKCSEIENGNLNTQVVEVGSSVALTTTLHHKETTIDTLKRANAEENLVILPKVPKLLNNEVLSSSTQDKSVEKNEVSNKETTSVILNTTISKTLDPSQLVLNKCSNNETDNSNTQLNEVGSSEA